MWHKTKSYKLQFYSYSFRSTSATAHLSFLVKPQDIVANAAGPAALHLVFVSEELLAGKASAVVQLSVG